LISCCVRLCFWPFSFLKWVCQSRENRPLLEVPGNPSVTCFYRPVTPVESVILLIFG
jgi:hypothetical protein